jgi:hypothetical protein
MPIGEYVSPDGQLKFVVSCPGGDWTMGFDGCSAHTHGSVLAELSGLDEVAAVESYPADLIGNVSVIALRRVSGALTDAWATDNPAEEVLSLQKYGASDETIEFRLWNGNAVKP